MNSIKILVLMALAWLSSPAYAALGSSSGLIANLRIEGTYGFIGLSQSLSGASSCGMRVWVDMNTDLGRSIYATAMMAFSAAKTTTIRAADESSRVFGECQLYDIYVAQ